MSQPASDDSPGATTAGLPASAYTDPQFLSAEQSGIFRKGWICIGVTDDVSAPGDAVPLRIANRDLVLLRDGQGEIRVHHNYCRHRGHPLLKEKVSGLKRLVCPYHAWAYDLDGTLRRVPHFDGAGAHRSGEAAAGLPGLEPVRTALWHHLVFINLSGDAAPFEEFIAPLADRWKAYDFSLLRHGKHLVYEAACNWKLAIENFIDFYHLPAVHKGLNGYSAMQDHYVIREDGIYFGEGNDRYAPDDAAAGRLPAFEGLPDELAGRTEALCLFPNLLITVFNDNLRIIIVDPLGARQVPRTHPRVLLR